MGYTRGNFWFGRANKNWGKQSYIFIESIHLGRALNSSYGNTAYTKTVLRLFVPGFDLTSRIILCYLYFQYNSPLIRILKLHVGIRGDLEIKQPFWPLWIIWFAFFAYYAVSFFFLLVFFRLSLNTLPFSLFYTFDMSCMRCHVFILFIGIRDLIPGLIALAFYGVEGRMFCILFSAMHTLMELLMNPMCIALLISQSLQ